MSYPRLYTSPKANIAIYVFKKDLKVVPELVPTQSRFLSTTLLTDFKYYACFIPSSRLCAIRCFQVKTFHLPAHGWQNEPPSRRQEMGQDSSGREIHTLQSRRSSPVYCFPGPGKCRLASLAVGSQPCFGCCFRHSRSSRHGGADPHHPPPVNIG